MVDIYRAAKRRGKYPPLSPPKRRAEAILLLFGCSEVNSTLLITSELTNQRARKALFTCVVYTNLFYWRKASFIIKSAGLTKFFALRCSQRSSSVSRSKDGSTNGTASVKMKSLRLWSRPSISQALSDHSAHLSSVKCQPELLNTIF